MSKENVEEFIGSPKYQSAKFYEHMPPGVVIGLAYSSHGGSILYIETSKLSNPNSSENKTGSLKVTGQLGSVMQESSSIALTFARKFILEHFKNSDAS